MNTKENRMNKPVVSAKQDIKTSVNAMKKDIVDDTKQQIKEDIIKIGETEKEKYIHLLLMSGFNYREISWMDNSSTVSEKHPATKFSEYTTYMYLLLPACNRTK